MSALKHPKQFPYQDLIINTCVISFVVGPNSRITDANDQFFSVLGLVQDDKKPVYINTLIDQENHWEDIKKDLKENDNNASVTIKLYDSNGSPVFLKSNLGVVEEKIYVIAINITGEVDNINFRDKVNKQAQLGGWSFNPELDIAYWTDSIFEILEIEERFEVHRDTIFKYIHPDYLELFNSTVDLFYKDQEPYDISFKIITEKSNTKWVRFTAFPEVRNGEVVFVNGTLQDITTQKKQAVSLEETKINMELALRAMNSGYFTHYIDSGMVNYSSHFRDRMNMPPSISTDEFLTFIHPDDRDEALVQHEREMETDSVYYVNAYRFKTHTSDIYKHFEVHGFKVFNNQGMPEKLVGNLIDVEDKYRLTQMQDKHRYHVKTLLDNAFVRSIMLDQDWNVLGMDGDTLKLFTDRLGFNPIIKRKNFKELLSAPDILKFQIIERVLDDGREYRKEVFLELFDSNRTYYDALCKPILDYSNHVDGYVFYFFDLTDQILVQEELQSYQEKLKTVHHFKNNIITQLGREIKPPLDGLLKTTKLIFKRKTVKEEEKVLLKAQKESAKRLMHTFDNIINSSLYEDNFYLIKDEINLNLILQQVYDGGVNRATAKGLDLFFNNFDTTIKVQADPIFLKQALENLLDNAFKFTEVGKIKIFTDTQDDYAIITLQDTGAGIPQDKLDEIFKPLQNNEEQINYEMEGLGLIFAIKYVEGIGGYLHVESEMKTGTIYKLALPIING